jgi:hypothetical protein
MTNTFTGVLMEYNNGALDEMIVDELKDLLGRFLG